MRPDGDELVVSCRRRGDPRAARDHGRATRRTPRRSSAPVAEQAADALAKLTYGAFLSVAIETNETTAMPYDGVYAIATPGRVFDMFTNQAHALRTGPRRPGGSLMLFAGAQAAAALMRESDEVIVERFLADLHALYPQTRGVDRERDGPALGARQRLREPRPRRASSPPWRARSAPTRTCTWPATTSPSWGRWRPPPRPGSRPLNESNHESERSPMSEPSTASCPR